MRKEEDLEAEGLAGDPRQVAEVKILLQHKIMLVNNISKIFFIIFPIKLRFSEWPKVVSSSWSSTRLPRFAKSKSLQREQATALLSKQQLSSAHCQQASFTSEFFLQQQQKS